MRLPSTTATGRWKGAAKNTQKELKGAFSCCEKSVATNDDWGTTIRIYRIPRAGADAISAAVTLQNLASPK